MGLINNYMASLVWLLKSSGIKNSGADLIGIVKLMLVFFPPSLESFCFIIFAFMLNLFTISWLGHAAGL